MANTFKSTTSGSIGTTLTNVYTCPGSTTTIILGASLANIDNNRKVKTINTVTNDIYKNMRGTNVLNNNNEYNEIINTNVVENSTNNTKLINAINSANMENKEGVSINI